MTTELLIDRNITPTRFVFLLLALGFEFFHGLRLFVKFFIALGSSLLVVRHDLEESGYTTFTCRIIKIRCNSAVALA